MVMRTTGDPYGGAAPIVDKLIGEAYPNVKLVADNLDKLDFVATNMPAIQATAAVTADFGRSAEESAETATAMAATATTAATQAAINATAAHDAVTSFQGNLSSSALNAQSALDSATKAAANATAATNAAISAQTNAQATASAAGNATVAATTSTTNAAKTAADVTTTAIAAATATARALEAAGSVNSVKFRNLIINGDMRISERFGSTESYPTASGYTLDRWGLFTSQLQKISIQRIQSTLSNSAYSARLKVTSPVALVSGDFFHFVQAIEGFNIGDLQWGTPNAQPIAVSFLAKSSVGGKYSAAIRNKGSTRSYIFTYDLVAGVEAKVSVVIPGDTGFGWATDNTLGLSLAIDMGAGTTYIGTPRTWNGGNTIKASGTVNLMATLGATYEITNVQIERLVNLQGLATPFEHRNIAAELAMCERYYEGSYISNAFAPGNGESSNMAFVFRTPKRAIPTISGSLYSSSGAVQNQAVSPYGFTSVVFTTFACTGFTGTYLAEAEL